MSIVVIDPVSSGINYINAAQQLGVGVYVFSCDGGEQELNAELRAKVRQVIKIDTGDFEAQLKKINELGDVRAVLPGVEYAVPMAARLGAASGTTHLHDSAVEKVRNKFNFRSRLTEAGLSTIGVFPSGCPRAGSCAGGLQLSGGGQADRYGGQYRCAQALQPSRVD